MIDLKHIHKDAEVIGADGVHIGIVDHVDGDRLKLTRKDSVDNRHHYIPAILIAHVEGAYDNEADKNRLCGVVPHPDSDTDWLRTTFGNAMNTAQWGADPALQTWLAESRLDGFSSTAAPSAELIDVVIEFAGPAIVKLQQYLAELDAR